MSNGPSGRFVPYQQEDRQWDARFNVQLDEDFERVLSHARSEWNSGKLKYILVSGIEVGDKQFQDDFQIKHVHVALIYHNRVSKRSVLKNLGVKEGNGYYLVPRNRSLPYAGWRRHHTKEQTKLDPTKLIAYEMGALPEDKGAVGQSITKRSEEEKKRKVDDILIEMRGMIEDGDYKAAFEMYPRTYLQYGEKLKAMINQGRDKLKSDGHPHIWLYGSPGCGKSALLNYIYPTYYKKNLYNKFFDLYNPDIHTHVMLEDLDHDAVDRLSTNFLKTLCDETGFAIDQKYKTPQLTRASILVTSNFTIPQIIGQSDEANVFGREENKNALLRRFWHIDAREFLRAMGVKLIPKYEIQMLKRQGNNDPGKLFMGWDYLTDTPTGQPIPEPAAFQELIKEKYYATEPAKKKSKTT